MLSQLSDPKGSPQFGDVWYAGGRDRPLRGDDIAGKRFVSRKRRRGAKEHARALGRCGGTLRVLNGGSCQPGGKSQILWRQKKQDLGYLVHDEKAIEQTAAGSA